MAHCASSIRNNSSVLQLKEIQQTPSWLGRLIRTSLSVAAEDKQVFQHWEDCPGRQSNGRHPGETHVAAQGFRTVMLPPLPWETQPWSLVSSEHLVLPSAALGVDEASAAQAAAQRAGSWLECQHVEPLPMATINSLFLGRFLQH